MEQKRDLYAPLRRPEDFQLTWPLLPGEQPKSSLPACTGHCQQGDKQCTTPDACRLPEGEARVDGIQAGVFVWPALMALALFAVLAVVHFLKAWQ
jgi:hypothetical protein